MHHTGVTLTIPYARLVSIQYVYAIVSNWTVMHKETVVKVIVTILRSFVAIANKQYNMY